MVSGFWLCVGMFPPSRSPLAYSELDYVILQILSAYVIESRWLLCIPCDTKPTCPRLRRTPAFGARRARLLWYIEMSAMASRQYCFAETPSTPNLARYDNRNGETFQDPGDSWFASASSAIAIILSIDCSCSSEMARDPDRAQSDAPMSIKIISSIATLCRFPLCGLAAIADPISRTFIPMADA